MKKCLILLFIGSSLLGWGGRGGSSLADIASESSPSTSSSYVTIFNKIPLDIKIKYEGLDEKTRKVTLSQGKYIQIPCPNKIVLSNVKTQES